MFFAFGTSLLYNSGIIINIKPMSAESYELPTVTEEQLIASLSDLIDENSIRNIWNMRATDKIDIAKIRQSIQNIQTYSSAKMEAREN